MIGAETADARNLGVKLEPPAIEDIAAIEELREAIAAVVGAPSGGSPVVPNGWTTRDAARSPGTSPGSCRIEPTARS